MVMKLQALIEERHMKKGDRLPAERQLATSLGVSRPSLREAIQQLNSQGVLISRRGDGTYIQQLPEQWPQQLIVNPISNLIEEDPLYRFDLLQYNVLLGRKKVYNDPVNGDLLSEQHFQVMDAIDRKDPEAARQAVCGHIEFVINHVRSLDEDEARQKRANRLNRVDSK
ncbi:GntR family transcriptional regulator [Acinetobacter baumannii]